MILGAEQKPLRNGIFVAHNRHCANRKRTSS